MNRNLSSAYDIICGRRILGTIQDQPWLLIYIPAALRPEGRLESWERSYRFTDDEGPKSSPEHPWNIIHQCILKLEQKTKKTKHKQKKTKNKHKTTQKQQTPKQPKIRAENQPYFRHHPTETLRVH